MNYLCNFFLSIHNSLCRVFSRFKLKKIYFKLSVQVFFFSYSCWRDVTQKGNNLIDKCLCSLDITNSVNFVKPVKIRIMNFIPD